MFSVVKKQYYKMNFYCIKCLMFTKNNIIKVGLLPSNFFICFHDSSLQTMKKAFCPILKALLVLKIFTFFSRLFGHVQKELD